MESRVFECNGEGDRHRSRRDVAVQIGVRDSERVPSLRDQGLLARQGDGAGQVHVQRHVCRRRVPVGGVFLPRRQEPRGQLGLRVGVHRASERGNGRQGVVRAHFGGSERKGEA